MWMKLTCKKCDGSGEEPADISNRDLDGFTKEYCTSGKMCSECLGEGKTSYQVNKEDFPEGD